MPSFRASSDSAERTCKGIVAWLLSILLIQISCVFLTYVSAYFRVDGRIQDISFEGVHIQDFS